MAPSLIRFFESIRDQDDALFHQLIPEYQSLLSTLSADEESLGDLRDATSVHIAARLGRRDRLRSLLDRGADINAKNRSGRTPLLDAFEWGQSIAQELIVWGASVDVNAAAAFGLHERLKEILEQNPSLANDRSTQITPSSWASYGGQLQSLRLLKQYGSRLDDGELLCAAQVNRVDVGEELLKLGVEIDAVFEGHRTALHVAVQAPVVPDTTEFIGFLLARGADPKRPNGDGLTPLDLIERARQEQPHRERLWIQFQNLIREACQDSA